MILREIRAPLLVGVVGVIGVSAFVILFGSVEKTVVGPAEGYRVTADFEDASGLASHSRVTISGIPVGTIESISLVTLPDGQTRARVVIRMREDIALYAGEEGPDREGRNGAVITRRTATLLGDYYLEISPGFSGRRLQDGDPIPNVIGEAGIMALTSKIEKVTDLAPTLQKIANDVSRITGSLSGVYGGPDGQARMERLTLDIEKAAKDIAAITGEIRTFVGEDVTAPRGRVARILGNIERFSADAARFSGTSADSLARAVQNVEVITREIRDLLAEGAGAQEGESVRGSLARLHASLGNLESASRHLASIAEKVDSGQGTLGRLVHDDTLVRKTEEVVTEVGDLVKSVSRLETQVGFRTEYNLYQRALKNYLSLRLQPSREKYYEFAIVFDPRGKTSTLQRLTLTNDPAKPPALTERVTETRLDLKFSLMFARRLAFLTGRFGLIESTGGLGLDLEFFRDSLKFSFDLFDFTSDQFPRLKFLWSFTFLEHFFVAAGVDDILNKAGRDYFLGAGFRFTDNDLKALLITSPSLPVR